MVLKPAALAGWRDELAELQRRIGELFGRPEPRRQAGLYLEGLLGSAERKNGWQLAEAIGDDRPWRTQRVLSHVLWDQDKARDLCRSYVVEHLGAPDGVLIVDETGFVKKGTQSAGVARQYSGTAGRIETCQIGVFLAYASAKGHALIDRDLYLPKEWTDDRERCAAAAVPEDVEFATKPRLAQGMIERAITAGVPFSWVLGDEVYGNDRRLRMWLEQHDRPHVLAVKATEPLWARVAGQGPIQVPAQDLATAEPQEGWRRLSAGAGSKGERLYDWARFRLFRLQQAPWEHWLLVRRKISKPEEMAYYVVFGPADTSLEVLARIAGQRWSVEECFEAAKQEVGLDGYEVRSWHGWSRHMTLSMLALAFLAAMRVKLAPKKGGKPVAFAPIAFSMPEIRRLIARFQMSAGFCLEGILAWSLWRRIHQAGAKACHWKRQAAKLLI
jgi:SRSO17 transposase